MSDSHEICVVEYAPSVVKFGYSLDSIDHEVSSVACQWSMFILFIDIPSIMRFIEGTPRKCRAVSTITPRHLKRGASFTETGRLRSV